MEVKQSIHPIYKTVEVKTQVAVEMRYTLTLSKEEAQHIRAVFDGLVKGGYEHGSMAANLQRILAREIPALEQAPDGFTFRRG